MSNNSFFEKLKYNYSQRQTFRFFMFTYPKITALVGMTTLAGITLATVYELNDLENFHVSFKNTIHSNDTASKRNNKMLIYNSESNK